ncbi:MAG: hypothetical protein ABIK92_17900 [Pseudomonadota bacterium]
MNKIYLRVIIYALLFCLILNGIIYLYGVNDLPFSPDISNFVFSAIALLSNFSLALAAGNMIAAWLNNFSTKNLITRLSVIGLIGCVICIYNVVTPIINHKYISEIESLIMHQAKNEASSGLCEMIDDNNFPLKRRAIVSYNIAKSKYANYGVLSEVINEKGEQHIYSPSKSEIEQREEMIISRLKALYSLQMAKNNIYYSITFWLSVFFFSMGFALVNRKNI